MSDRTSLLRGRLAVLAVTVLLASGVVLARLAYLQLYRGTGMHQQARENATRVVRLPAPRGRIFDCRGELLLGNAPRFAIWVVPAQARDVEGVASALARALRRPPELVARRLDTASPDAFVPVVLSDRLDEAGLARVAEVQGAFPGVMLETVPVRDYPQGRLAAHVLGYIGEIDAQTLQHDRFRSYLPGEWVGRDGLELAWESSLRGRPGQRLLRVDARGQVLGVVSETPAAPGRDLWLTLDARLQRVAEESLAAALARLHRTNGERAAGAVVALDPNNGEVRALASQPGYEPAWFSEGASQEVFRRIFEDPLAPMFNRAVAGSFPPASTFKLVTSVAALSEGAATASSTFSCPGYQMVGDLRFNCFVTSGHGTLDFQDSLAHSCDVTFYRLGTRLGAETLGRYARRLGLGAKTGIGLPGETAGLWPDPGWKQRELGESWFAGDDANLAIGQGFLTASPLQMAVVTAAVANGGTLYRPRLVRGEIEAGRRLDLAEGVLETVRRGMRGAVVYGTATRANSPLLEIAGKTGTVENVPTSDNPGGRNHTWFAAFGPWREPELVVVVFLERSGGYGGATAAPVARAVLEGWHRLRAVRSSGVE